MNRLNHKVRNAIIRYLKYKKKYYNSQNVQTGWSYHWETKEAYKWCTIVETIRKGYKRAE